MHKLLSFALLLFTFGCGTSSETAAVKENTTTSFKEGISFKDISLKLTELQIGEDSWKNADVEITLMLNMEKASYNGKSGCNSFFGSIEKISETRIKTGMAGVTEMMCLEDVMQWEARYLNALTEHEFVVYEAEESIQIKDMENGVVLTFSKR